MLNRIIRRLKLVYSSLPWARWLIKKVSATEPYFRLTKGKIETQSQKDSGGPFNLVIETSNFCNARCLMCPHPAMKRREGVMTEEVFSKIVERVKAENLPINKVFFSGLGEPLTDPNLISRLKTFKDLGFPIRLYTNASLMTPEISRQLVDLEIDEINISFNGTNPGQYWQVMGLDFEKTKANIENLIELRQEKKVKKPFFQISSVLIEENKKDIKRHLETWRDKVDSVTVSLAHQWGGGVKIDSDLKDSGSERTYPCRSLWHTFMIDSSGSFVICCRDFESSVVLGSIKTHSFSGIRRNQVLEKFKDLHLNFSPDELPAICRQCNFPFQDGIEWHLPRSID